MYMNAKHLYVIVKTNQQKFKKSNNVSECYVYENKV